METDNSTKKTIIAYFSTQAQSEQAITQLHKKGFDMQSFSVIAMDLYAIETIKGYYTLLDRMKKWAKIGAIYGAFWGLLFGANIFTIPFIGHLIIAGPLTVVGITLASGLLVGLISGLAAAVLGFNHRGKQHLKYHTEIKAGKYALVGQLDQPMIAKARETLKIRISKRPFEPSILNDKEETLAEENSGIIHLDL